MPLSLWAPQRIIDGACHTKSLSQMIAIKMVLVWLVCKYVCHAWHIPLAWQPQEQMITVGLLTLFVIFLVFSPLFDVKNAFHHMHSLSFFVSSFFRMWRGHEFELLRWKLKIFKFCSIGVFFFFNFFFFNKIVCSKHIGLKVWKNLYIFVLLSLWR